MVCRCRSLRRGGGVFCGERLVADILTADRRGLRWTDLGTLIDDTAIVCLAYLGNGICLAGTSNNGKIGRSTDYGLTWTDLGTIIAGETTIFSLAYLGNGICLAGTYLGGKIARSIDYGETWTPVKGYGGEHITPPVGTIIAGEGYILSLAYLGNGICLAGTRPNAKIARSTDFGENWVELTDDIAFDAVSVGQIASGTELTFSHTCSGSNRILLVGIKEASDTAEYVTGVTYNGVALTKIDSIRIPPSERWVSLWYLINPDSGTHDIVITANASTFMRGSGASYTGVRQSGQPESSATNSEENQMYFNSARRPQNDGRWVVMFVGNSLGVQVAGTGTTLRGTASDSNIMDSNGPHIPQSPSSTTLQATYPSWSTCWASIIIILVPAHPMGWGADWLRALDYLGNGICLAVTEGGGKIARSTDYGETWTDLGQLDSGGLYSLAYLDNGICLAGGSGRIYRSTDFGKTWTNLGTIIAGEDQISCLTYLGNGICLAGTQSSGHIARSTDFGLTWTDLGADIISPTNAGQLYSLAYLGNGICLAGSGNMSKMGRSVVWRPCRIIGERFRKGSPVYSEALGTLR